MKNNIKYIVRKTEINDFKNVPNNNDFIRLFLEDKEQIKQINMKCPHCNKEIDDTLIAKHLASKGGKKSSSNLTKEQRMERSKKAIQSRWNKLSIKS